MNKSYMAASSVGAVMLVLSGSAMAAVPVTDDWFDKWTVTSGTVDFGSYCPTTGVGGSCTAALVEKGFAQRTMVDTFGVTYFQTIIVGNNDSASTVAELGKLNFVDESFVRTGNVGGLADKQRLYEVVENKNGNGVATGGSTTFSAATTLKSGWAGTAVSIDQHLLDDFDKFQTDFFFRQKGDNKTPAAQAVKVTAYVPLLPVTPPATGAAKDDQHFVLVKTSGEYTDQAGTATVQQPVRESVNGVMTDVLKDRTMTWSVGQNVQAIWIGQDLGDIVGQPFAYSSYINITEDTPTSPNRAVGYSLVQTEPLNNSWDDAVWGDRRTSNYVPTAGVVTNPFQ